MVGIVEESSISQMPESQVASLFIPYLHSIIDRFYDFVCGDCKCSVWRKAEVFDCSAVNSVVVDPVPTVLVQGCVGLNIVAWTRGGSGRRVGRGSDSGGLNGRDRVSSRLCQWKWSSRAHLWDGCVIRRVW